MAHKSGYWERIGDNILAQKLLSSGAVLIEGAKWCGKTSTAANMAESALYMQDPDRGASYHMLAETQPSYLLKGDVPRLLDEWQTAPVLWDAVRFEVDKRKKVGQFILTGSAVPLDGATQHTGTGRIARMLMRPMSLWESRESNGDISLENLFNGKVSMVSESPVTVEAIAYAICRGGWPAAITTDTERPLAMAQDYLEAVIETDLNRVDGIRRDPRRVRLLLHSLARNVSTLATQKTIMGDVSANDVSFTYKTYESYMNALERIYLVEDIPAWQPSIRSKSAIRTANKRQMVDPSIAAAALRMAPGSLMDDFNTFGFLFESLCARDLRVYAQAIDGDIFHYRDSSGLESDFIIRLHDGRWAAIEAKLGSRQEEEAAHNLLKLSKKINTEKVGAPVFLMVLTAGRFAMKRPDGVWVVPLACLRP